MSSFTFQGSSVKANQWLPFAVAKQHMMKLNGIQRNTVTPDASTMIMISTNPPHIHIRAGMGGYEFSIYNYGTPTNDVEVGPGEIQAIYFLDKNPSTEGADDGFGGIAKVAGCPFQDDAIPFAPVQKNHINMWIPGDGRIMTGCAGQRYGGAVAFSTADMVDQIAERLPRFVDSRQKLWEGDESVTAASIFSGSYVGVTMTGQVFIWGEEKTSLNPVSGVHCYWVFNKVGDQCVGIDYPAFDAEVERVGTVHILNFSVSEGTIDVAHSSYEAERGTYCVDYDYTEEANELISLRFEASDRATYTHFPEYSGRSDFYYLGPETTFPPDYSESEYLSDIVNDPFNGLRYMDSKDVVMVISRGPSSKLLEERIPFAYNYYEDLAPLAIPDPADVTYKGQLFGLDLRYRTYCILSHGWIPYGQYVINPHTPTDHANVAMIVNGKTLASGGLTAGNTIPYEELATLEKESPPEASMILWGSVRSLDKCQVPAVSPDLEGVGFFMRTQYTGLSTNIDVVTSEEANVFGTYHGDTLDKLKEATGLTDDDLLIAAFSNWTG